MAKQVIKDQQDVTNVNEINVNESNATVNEINVNETIETLLNKVYPIDGTVTLPTMPKELINFNFATATADQLTEMQKYAKAVADAKENVANIVKENDSMHVLVNGIFNADNVTEVHAFLVAWLKEYAPAKVAPANTAKRTRNANVNADPNKNFAARVVNCIAAGMSAQAMLDSLVATFTDKPIDLIVSNAHWYATNKKYAGASLPQVEYTVEVNGELVTKTSNSLVTLHKYGADLNDVYYS